MSTHSPLYKTTIVVWSEKDPGDMELEDIAHEAKSGSYQVGFLCSRQTTELIQDLTTDPDWRETEFFKFSELDE
jgi:hypothetical protein